MYKYLWTPIKQYSAEQQALRDKQTTIEKTSAASKDQNVVRIGIDSFYGTDNLNVYTPIFSSSFSNQCELNSINVDLKEDKDEFLQRLKDIKEARLDLAVMPINELIRCSVELNEFPATIIMVLNELKGEFSVLVVRRDYLLKHQDIVEKVVKSYLTTIYKDNLFAMTKKDTEASVSKEALERLSAWKNTQDNYSYFGIVDKANSPHIEKTCRNVIRNLIKSNVIKTDPTNNKPNILYFDGVISKLHKSSWHPNALNQDVKLPTLSDSEWAVLNAVETNLPSLVFVRGTDKLSPSNETTLSDVVQQLKNKPQYYIFIKSGISLSGDEETNLKLANSREESTVKWQPCHLFFAKNHIKGFKMIGLKRRILIDLLITPLTIIPFAAGISFLILSEIIGATGVFVGLCLCVFGIASVVLNLVLNLNNIVKKAVKDLQSVSMREFDAKLDKIYKRLCTDDDNRDQQALKNIRTIYKQFVIDLDSGKIKNIPPAMVTHIQKIYEEVIKHLVEQFEIWETSNSITGKLKTELLAQREKMIVEIEKSVSDFAQSISEIRALGLKTGDGELTRLQERLQVQLEVAKNTQEIVSGDEYSRFNEYEKH